MTSSSNKEMTQLPQYIEEMTFFSQLNEDMTLSSQFYEEMRLSSYEEITLTNIEGKNIII